MVINGVEGRSRCWHKPSSTCLTLLVTTVALALLAALAMKGVFPVPTGGTVGLYALASLTLGCALVEHLLCKPQASPRIVPEDTLSLRQTGAPTADNTFQQNFTRLRVKANLLEVELLKKNIDNAKLLADDVKSPWNIVAGMLEAGTERALAPREERPQDVLLRVLKHFQKLNLPTEDMEQRLQNLGITLSQQGGGEGGPRA